MKKSKRTRALARTFVSGLILISHELLRLDIFVNHIHVISKQ